jgi:hypothetical protein
MRQTLKAMVVLLGLVVLLVFLLPYAVSLGPAERLILQAVNERIDGTLAVEDWSFRWLKGMAVHGVTYTDAVSQTRVDIKAIRSTHGMFALVKPVKSLGAVYVVEPRIVLGPLMRRRARRPKIEHRQVVPVLPVLPVRDVSARLRIRDGDIQVVNAQGERVSVVTAFNAGITAEGLRKPLAFDIAGTQGGALGRIEIKGTVIPADRARLDEALLGVQVEGQVWSYELGPLTQVLSRFVDCPEINGRVDAQFGSRMVTAGDIEATGTLVLKDLAPVVAETSSPTRLADVRADFRVLGTGKRLSELLVRVDAPFVQARMLHDGSDALTINLSSDLEAFTREAAKFIDVKGRKILGTLNTRITVRDLFDPVKAMTCDAAVHDLVVGGTGDGAWREPHVRVVVDGLWTPASGDLNLEAVKLSSEPLMLEGAGRVLSVDDTPVFSFEGTWLPDLACLSARLKGLTGLTVAMAGNQGGHFALSGPLAIESWQHAVERGRMQADMRVARYDYEGIAVSNVASMLTAADAVLHVQADGAVNGGLFNVAAVMDAGDAPPVFTMPAGTILRDAALSTPMARAVLGRMHPVFRDGVVLGGTMDGRLDVCRVPLTASWQYGADAAGAIVLKNVVLAPAGVLAEILSMIGEADAKVEIAREEIGFTYADGLVRPTPLTMQVAGHTVRASGAVGLDGSLDYMVEVPITRKLVGRDAYRYLDGQTIRISVGGSAKRPVVAREAFRQELGRLIREGAQEAIIRDGGELLKKLLER